ncbi:plasminogen receptor (KT) [Glossina fuscipes]|uniref:Plasminogen receptor (KT) n=1 Tax=Glossina fuscipes TaxID=7396 RepID=A0A9C5ZG27_9MUSC|nr:plasminogen receptor (KT) [Glossina fuscipes]
MGNKSTSHSSISYPQHDDPAYKKCQELKMERWIQMHYQIKEREQAMELARTRELFFWLSGFYLTSFFVTVSYYQRLKRPVVFLPMIPLTFLCGYYADMAYGSKLHRIKAEANMIMEHEPELLHWPGGLPTVASIDEARVEAEMEKKMHPHHS